MGAKQTLRLRILKLTWLGYGLHYNTLSDIRKVKIYLNDLTQFYEETLNMAAILTEFGQIDYDPDYNYKTQRARSWRKRANG